MYGSDTLSAFEMVKGFFKRILANQRPINADENLQSDHSKRISKRILTLILRLNDYSSCSFKHGDMLQVFINDF